METTQPIRRRQIRAGTASQGMTKRTTPWGERRMSGLDRSRHRTSPLAAECSGELSFQAWIRSGQRTRRKTSAKHTGIVERDAIYPVPLSTLGFALHIGAAFTASTDADRARIDARGCAWKALHTERPRAIFLIRSRASTSIGASAGVANDFRNTRGVRGRNGVDRAGSPLRASTHRIACDGAANASLQLFESSH